MLLYVEGDVERQFSLSARSRLTQREIQAVLRAIERLERLDRRKRSRSGEVLATAGEILPAGLARRRPAAFALLVVFEPDDARTAT